MLSKHVLGNVLDFLNDKEFCQFRGVNQLARSATDVVMDRRVKEIGQRQEDLQHALIDKAEEYGLVKSRVLGIVKEAESEIRSICNGLYPLHSKRVL